MSVLTKINNQFKVILNEDIVPQGIPVRSVLCCAVALKISAKILAAKDNCVDVQLYVQELNVLADKLTTYEKKLIPSQEIDELLKQHSVGLLEALDFVIQSVPKAGKSAKKDLLNNSCSTILTSLVDILQLSSACQKVCLQAYYDIQVSETDYLARFHHLWNNLFESAYPQAFAKIANLISSQDQDLGTGTILYDLGTPNKLKAFLKQIHHHLSHGIFASLDKPIHVDFEQSSSLNLFEVAVS